MVDFSSQASNTWLHCLLAHLLLTRNPLSPLSLLSCTRHLFLSAFKMISVSLKMKMKVAHSCLTL